MCQVIFNKGQLEDTYANSHWRETIQMFRVWEGIHNSAEPKSAYANTHGREALCLYRMWQVIYTKRPFEGAYECSCQKEKVWVGMHRCWFTEYLFYPVPLPFLMYFCNSHLINVIFLNHLCCKPKKLSKNYWISAKVNIFLWHKAHFNYISLVNHFTILLYSSHNLLYTYCLSVVI